MHEKHMQPHPVFSDIQGNAIHDVTVAQQVDAIEAVATESEWAHLSRRSGLDGEAPYDLEEMAASKGLKTLEMSRQEHAIIRAIKWKLAELDKEDAPPPPLSVRPTPIPDRTGIAEGQPIPSPRRGIFASEIIPPDCVVVDFEGSDGATYTVATQFTLEEIDHIARAHHAWNHPAFSEKADSNSQLRVLLYTHRIPWGHLLSNRREALRDIQKFAASFSQHNRYLERMTKIYPVIEETLQKVTATLEPFLPKHPQR